MGENKELRRAFVAAIQAKINSVKPPERLTEARAEYWKAGARAAIYAVEEALSELAKEPTP